MKFSKLTPVILPVLILQGCDSSDSSVQITDERPTASRPSSSTDLNVFNEFVAAAQTAPGAAAATTNLYTNGSFENGVADWSECLPRAISASTDAYEGTGALALRPDNCFYRSVSVSPGESYALSCFVKLTTERAWTGMGMTFSSSDYDALHQAPVAVATSGEYMRLETTGVAPAGTSFLSMWLHSDHGAVVDSCSLTLIENQNPAATISADNLLENSNFSVANDQGGAADWLAGCGGSVVANGSSLFLSDGACVDQALTPTGLASVQNSQSTFSCLVTNVQGYADLSVFFDNTLQGVKRILTTDINKRVELTVDAEQPGNGFVSLYSDGNLQVENCQMVASNNAVNTSPDVEPADTEDNIVTATSARYRLTFNSVWSAQTHPLNFPPPAHFSPLAGAVHNDSVEFWAPGQLATDGYELMAETGDPSGVLAEVASSIGNGSVSSSIDGGGIPNSPGSASIEFEVTRDHPLITVTSMVAPSPDWFIGVHGLSLLDGNDFADSMTIDLRVYDSGTDSGTLYTSADQDTVPASPISLLNSAPTDSPFQNGNPPIGQFVIQKLP